MSVYISYIAFLIFTSVLVMKAKQRKSLLAAMLLLIFLFSAFRREIGVDTAVYDYIFTQISIWGDTNFNIEDGYFLLNKIALCMGEEFYIVLLLSFGMTLFFTYEFITYFVPEKYRGISLVVFISSSFYFVYALSGIRQGIAMSLILYSVRYIVERRKLLFLLFILLAIFFHKSAAVFIPAYWIGNREIPYKWVLAGVALAFISRTFVSRLFFSIVPYLQGHYSVYSESYSGEANSNSGWGIIGRIFFWLVIAYFYQKNMRSADVKNMVPYNIYILGIILYVCCLNVDILIRLSEYFLSVSIAVIPLSMVSFKMNNRNLYIGFVMLLLSGLFFSFILFEKRAFLPYNSYLFI